MVFLSLPPQLEITFRQLGVVLALAIISMTTVRWDWHRGLVLKISWHPDPISFLAAPSTLTAYSGIGTTSFYSQSMRTPHVPNFDTSAQHVSYCIVPTASDGSYGLIPRRGARTGTFPILFKSIILLVRPVISSLHPLSRAASQLIMMLQPVFMRSWPFPIACFHSCNFGKYLAIYHLTKYH